MAHDLAGLRADAAGQDGQFAVAQAHSHGLTKSALAHLRRRGEIHVLRPGVGRFAAAPGDPDAAVTAYLACWPHAVISHDSAAAHHGLERVGTPKQPHVTVPHGITLRPRGIVVHRSRELAAPDIVTSGLVRYTTLVRCVLDLSDSSRPWETLSLLDDAVARGARPNTIHRRASELVNGRDGVALIRSATAPRASNVFRSWLERVSAHLYHVAHLPPPEWNVKLYDAEGLIGAADALWRLYRVISEKEGLRFHTSPHARRTDAARFNRLAEQRYAVRRFTWLDVVKTPVVVAATVAKALLTAGADIDLAAIPRRIEIPAVPFL